MSPWAAGLAAALALSQAPGGARAGGVEEAPEAGADEIRGLRGAEDAFEIATERRLTEDALEGIPLAALSLLRNAPFARAGLAFETPWIDAFFGLHPEYEPGEFDDDDLTDLERHNIRVVRTVEEGLDERELRARWRALWRQDGVGRSAPEAGEAWELPGAFEDIAYRIEARMLAEKLDRAYPRDPLFDPDAAIPIPEELGGVALGARAGDAGPRADDARGVRDPVLGAGKARVRADERGRIADVGVWDVGRTGAGRAALVRLAAASYGDPDRVADADGWYGDVAIWEGEGRRLEIGLEGATPAGADALLRDADPERPCGPRGGRAELARALSEAVRSDRPRAVRDHFAFPFSHDPAQPGLSDARVYADEAAAADHDGARAGVGYEQWWARAVDGDALEGVRPAGACDPITEEARLAGDGFYLDFDIARRGGAWRVVQTASGQACSFCPEARRARARAGPRRVCSADGWCWEAPREGAYPIWAAWSGAEQSFAVGRDGVALCRDGDRFYPQDTGTHADLRDIHGDGTQLFAVGSDGTILRHDGRRWQREESGVDVLLRGVWIDDEGTAWAVSSRGDVLVRREGRWRSMDTGAGAPLFGIWGSAPDDIYATGWGNDGSVRVHYDGEGWSDYDGPQIWRSQTIWGRGARDVWMCGQGQGLWHHAGSGWTRHAEISNCRGLWGDRRGQLYIAKRSGLSRFDGKEFHDAEPSGQLRAITGDRTGFRHAFSLRGDRWTQRRDAWRRDTRGPERDIRDIVQAEDGAIFAVAGTMHGRDGAVLRRGRDGSWRMDEIDLDRSLRSVHAARADLAIAGGSAGALGLYDGDGWDFTDVHPEKRVPPGAPGAPPEPAGPSFRDVWIADEDEAYAVGSEAWRWDGEAWTEMELPAPYDECVPEPDMCPRLNALWRAGDDLVAAADRGAILRWDGERWRAEDAPTDDDLLDLWKTPEGDLYVATSDSDVFARRGDGWHDLGFDKSDRRLRAIAVTEDDEVFVARQSREIWRYEGGAWTRERVGTARDLRALFPARDGSIFATGERGAILRRKAR